MKTCTKCGEAKPVSEFGKDASKRDGLRPSCRDCTNASLAARRAYNPENHRASSAKWQAENRERSNAIKANWADANKEKAKAAGIKWRSANPETRRIISNNRRARKCANGGRLSPGLAEKLFRLQRGKCACCRVSIADGSHLDHRIPLALEGPNEDWNMQLLCAPCNLSKGAKHPNDFMRQRGFLL